VGCSGDLPAAKQTGETDAEDPPTAAPATPQALPDSILTRWAITEQAFGVILFGMTVDQASQAVDEPFELDDPADGSECTYGRSASMPESMFLMVYEGRIARVDVDEYDRFKEQPMNYGFKTPEGIGIGSTPEEALAAYGGRAVVGPSKYGAETDVTIEVVDEAGTGVVFDTSNGAISTWRAGLAEQVYWVEGCS
jgi:hypothetical protein